MVESEVNNKDRKERKEKGKKQEEKGEGYREGYRHTERVTSTLCVMMSVVQTHPSLVSLKKNSDTSSLTQIRFIRGVTETHLSCLQSILYTPSP